jgi:hypothetical protein
MNRFLTRQIRRLIKSEQGQSVVMVAISATAILTLAVSSVEVGHVYYAYRQLVQSTNEATLAGAQAMSDALLNTASSSAYTAEVTAAVKQFSSVTPGGLNASNMLSGDQISSQTLFCSSTMSKAPFFVECQIPPGSSAGYNAISVTQTAKVNLWFGALVGMPSMNLSATSSAAMKGGSDIPYNLAIIMDTTASMKSTIPGDKDCTTSQISCAVQGLEVMLENMDPCAQNTTCSGAPYVDDVALFVFPAVPYSSTGNYKPQYCGTGVSSVPYNFVNVTSGSSQNLAMETTGTDAGAYEIIPFNNTYKTSDSSALAVATALGEAVGASGSGCTGLSAPGGQGTYYAQVIYAAQAQLALQQSGNSGSKNVMIILSDGDATACASGANTAAGGCNSASNIVAENNPNCGSTGGSCLNGTGTHTSNASGYQSPTYPSALGECGQAVQAAQLATAAGTVVYTIGFGSETSGCTTDKTYTTSSGSTDGAEAWPSGTYAGTPCNAIAAMASSGNTFYSDNSGGCPALDAANANFTSLAQIFEAIVDNLSTPRMIPNGTT